MKKFLVLYLAPVSVLEGWAKTDAKERDAMEAKMKDEWQTWMKEHRKMLTEMPAGAGKTKRVTSKGVSDIKNDIMLYGVVEAESHDAAAHIFENHPHLQIPEASIEIMPINPLPGMN